MFFCLFVKLSDGLKSINVSFSFLNYFCQLYYSYIFIRRSAVNGVIYATWANISQISAHRHILFVTTNLPRRKFVRIYYKKYIVNLIRCFQQIVIHLFSHTTVTFCWKNFSMTRHSSKSFFSGKIITLNNI